MIQGEYESLKAINNVIPHFAPIPYEWGKYHTSSPDTYFLLLEFRQVGRQPPDPMKFVSRLVKLHKRSASPTGKFGFHITTCHAKFPQITNCWESSWEELYRKQLTNMVKLDEVENGQSPEFQAVSKFLLDRVIARLLRPLQSGGRSIEPCLVHGDLWDENTAGWKSTSRPFIFDVGSFYAHNEYELGNWRAPRHRLSKAAYVQKYLKKYPPSEPRKSAVSCV